MEILKNPHYDFLGKTKFFVTLSILFIASGLLTIKTRGIHYGVEFSGGTSLIARFSAPPQIDTVREEVDKEAPGAVIQTYREAGKTQVLIRSAGINHADLALHARAGVALRHQRPAEAQAH